MASVSRECELWSASVECEWGVRVKKGVVKFDQAKTMDASRTIAADAMERLLAEELSKEPMIVAAWLYGSWARGEATPESDIDLIIEFDPKKKISYLNIFDLAHKLEERTGRKVDIVEHASLTKMARGTAMQDMIKIHG